MVAGSWIPLLDAFTIPSSTELGSCSAGRQEGSLICRRISEGRFLDPSHPFVITASTVRSAEWAEWNDAGGCC
jgi:hypothetical protein